MPVRDVAARFGNCCFVWRTIKGWVSSHSGGVEEQIFPDETTKLSQVTHTLYASHRSYLKFLWWKSLLRVKASKVGSLLLHVKATTLWQVNTAIHRRSWAVHLHEGTTSLQADSSSITNITSDTVCDKDKGLVIRVITPDQVEKWA